MKQNVTVIGCKGRLLRVVRLLCDVRVQKLMDEAGNENSGEFFL